MQLPLTSICRAHEMLPEWCGSHYLLLRTEPLFIRVRCNRNPEESTSRVQYSSTYKGRSTPQSCSKTWHPPFLIYLHALGPMRQLFLQPGRNQILIGSLVSPKQRRIETGLITASQLLLRSSLSSIGLHDSFKVDNHPSKRHPALVAPCLSKGFPPPS